MKLIYCEECGDIVRLRIGVRKCECGKSSGQYLSDGIHAEVWGSAIPIGFGNTSFMTAIRNRPKSGMGKQFDAFAIPIQCGTVVKV